MQAMPEQLVVTLYNPCLLSGSLKFEIQAASGCPIYNRLATHACLLIQNENGHGAKY